MNLIRDSIISTENKQFLQNRCLSTPWFLSFRCLNIRQKELQKRNFRLASIRCAENSPVLIPPNSQVTIHGIKTKCILHPPVCALIHATPRSVIPDDLDTEPVVVSYTYDDQSTIPVNISNVSTRTLTVNPRSLICELQYVSIEDPQIPMSNNAETPNISN